MIDQAKKDYDLKLTECFIIGDKITDMQAGQAGGIRHKLLVGKLPKERFAKIDHLHIIPNTLAICESMQTILSI